MTDKYKIWKISKFPKVCPISILFGKKWLIFVKFEAMLSLVTVLLIFVIILIVALEDFVIPSEYVSNDELDWVFAIIIGYLIIQTLGKTYSEEFDILQFHFFQFREDADSLKLQFIAWIVANVLILILSRSLLIILHKYLKSERSWHLLLWQYLQHRSKPQFIIDVYPRVMNDWTVVPNDGYGVIETIKFHILSVLNQQSIDYYHLLFLSWFKRRIQFEKLNVEVVFNRKVGYS